MALTDVDLRRFFWRTLLTIGAIVFGLSLALNLFFIQTGPLKAPLTEESIDDEPDSNPLIVERWGFGVIERPVPHQEQRNSVLRLSPVDSYIVPEGMLPSLRDELPLYRDQGMSLDIDAMEKLWSTIRAPFSFEKWSLTPTLYEWKSGDGMKTFTLDPKQRVLEISDANMWDAREEPLTEEEFTVLASDALTALSVDYTTLDDPVIEQPEDGTMVIVRYPKLWNLLPLLNQDGTQVFGAEVELDIASGFVMRIRLHLLHPDLLTVSDYPVATSEALVAEFGSGGLLPLPRTPASRAEEVTFTSFDQVFLYLAANSQNPPYIVPALRGQWIQEQTCAGCAPVLLSTYVPLISEEQFMWR